MTRLKPCCRRGFFMPLPSLEYYAYFTVLLRHCVSMAIMGDAPGMKTGPSPVFYVTGENPLMICFAQDFLKGTQPYEF